MKSVLCAIFILLSPFAFAAELNIQHILKEFLDWPWGKETPATLLNQGYSVSHYGQMNRLDDQGYASHCYSKVMGHTTICYFAYYVPSLTEIREQILSGYIEIETEDTIHASQIQLQLEQWLKANCSDSRIEVAHNYHGFGSFYWRSVKWISCNGLFGLFYQKFPGSGDRKPRVTLNLEAPERRILDKDFRYESRPCYDPAIDGRLKELNNQALHKVVAKQRSSCSDTSFWAILEYIAIPSLHSLLEDKKLMDFYDEIDRKVDDETEALFVKDIALQVLFSNLNQTPVWKEPLSDYYKKWFSERHIVYEFEPLGASYQYNWQYMKDLAVMDGGNFLSQLSFLNLLARGWAMMVSEHKDPDDWKRVIAIGEEYLVEHSESPFSTDVKYIVGMAYETLFNLATLENASYVDPGNYSLYREEARLRALEYYERVSIEKDGIRYLERLMYILPRLRGGVSTGLLRFYFVYD